MEPMRWLGLALLGAVVAFGIWFEWVRVKPKPKRDTPANREGGIQPYRLPENHPPVDLPDPSEHKPIFLLPGKRKQPVEVPPDAKP